MLVFNFQTRQFTMHMNNIGMEKNGENQQEAEETKKNERRIPLNNIIKFSGSAKGRKQLIYQHQK